MIFVLVVPAKNSNIATAPIFNARFLQVWVCFLVREAELECLFWGIRFRGVKRTSRLGAVMSAFDPKRPLVDAKGQERIGRALGHSKLISEQSEPLPFDFAGQRTLIGVEEHFARHFELAQEVKNF